MIIDVINIIIVITEEDSNLSFQFSKKNSIFLNGIAHFVTLSYVKALLAHFNDDLLRIFEFLQRQK